MAGDNTGLANLASTGMLGTASAVYFSGTLDGHPSQLHDLMSQGADLVVTDTNRKQAMRWDGLTAITGFTETPSENLTTSDPSDSPLELFPGTGNDTKTHGLLRRSRQRDRLQLRQPGVVPAREPGLPGGRRQPGHLVGDGRLHPQPHWAMVAALAPASGHGGRGHAWCSR